MPARRQARKASKARPPKRKRSIGEFSETGFNPKTGEPTGYAAMRKAARATLPFRMSHLVVPAAATERAAGRVMRKKTIRKKK